MNATELRTALDELGIRQAELAQLVGVTARAVSLWATEQREVPGPVAAYLRLLASLPRALQAKELARIRQKDPGMYEGLYKFEYIGREGSGYGMLFLADGRVFGSDGAGGEYDGAYVPSPTRSDYIDMRLRVTVPPGVPLVTGMPPQPMTYSFEVQGSFAARGETELDVHTPYGPVRAAVTFLRPLPQ